MDPKSRYDSLFQFYGYEYGVDWKLLKAQALAESDMNPNAVSPVGAKGLTQFMDRTWEEWRDGVPGVQPPKVNLVAMDPFNPEASIKAQAAMMSWLMKSFPTYQWALAAYNWGFGRVHTLLLASMGDSFDDLKSHCPVETQKYVLRIEEIYKNA